MTKMQHNISSWMVKATDHMGAASSAQSATMRASVEPNGRDVLEKHSADGRNTPQTASFRGVVLCSLPDSPGDLQERLIVVDVKDRALFVGDPRQDEWQEFPVRIFLPLARVDLEGNTVKVVGIEQGEASVHVLFNFRSDATVLMSAIEKTYGETNGRTSKASGIATRATSEASPPRVNGTVTWASPQGSDVHEGTGSGTMILSAQPSSLLRSLSSRSPPAKALTSSPTPSTNGLVPERPKVAAQLGYPAEAQGNVTPGTDGVVQGTFAGQEAVANRLVRALEKKLDAMPDKKFVAAHRLATVTVGQACKSKDDSLYVVDDQTALDAVASNFEEHEYLLYIDRNGVEHVICRRDFAARLVLTSIGYSKKTFREWMTESLADHGVDNFPKLPSLNDSQRLGDAFLIMMEAKAQEMTVTNNHGQITGVISYKQIISLLTTDFKLERALNERPSASSSTSKLPMRFITSKDPFDGWGAFRTATAVWVTSAVTEITIIGLTFVDISASVIDYFVFNPCIVCEEEYAVLKTYKDNTYNFATPQQCMAELQLFDCDYAGTLGHPMNAFTGAILILFIAESLARLYAFRFNMFASALDVLDFCIVYASATTFIWMVAASGSKLVRQIVTVGRIMRFLRLIRMFNKIRKAIFRDKQVRDLGLSF